MGVFVFTFVLHRTAKDIGDLMVLDWTAIQERKAQNSKSKNTVWTSTFEDKSMAVKRTENNRKDQVSRPFYSIQVDGKQICQSIISWFIDPEHSKEFGIKLAEDFAAGKCTKDTIKEYRRLCLLEEPWNARLALEDSGLKFLKLDLKKANAEDEAPGEEPPKKKAKAEAKKTEAKAKADKSAADKAQAKARANADKAQAKNEAAGAADDKAKAKAKATEAKATEAKAGKSSSSTAKGEELNYEMEELPPPSLLAHAQVVTRNIHASPTELEAMYSFIGKPTPNPSA